MASKPYYVTTPIYYVNAQPHIGHIYTTLVADTLARYHKLLGEDVQFMTGTDEHGQKIERAAAAKNVTPEEFTADIANQFKSAFTSMGFEWDHFIRTSDAEHMKEVQNMWTILEGKGFIELGTHEGWYCVSDEAFCTELQVEEVVRDGKTIKVSKESGHPVEWIVEENFKFKLSAFEDKLLAFFKENPNWIIPQFRQKEIEKFVAGGLQDLSVSRKKKICQWAVPVPPNEAHKTEEEHCVYVWLDALTNYITSAKVLQGQGKPYAWPADMHVIGKDILKFHAIYWPAFLLAAELPLPKRLIAHGWWTKDGMKISKSLGNAFDPVDKANEYGLDALKYFLLRESSFSDDGDYSDVNMVARLNGELADNLGNLFLRCVSRTLNPEAKVPQHGEFNEDDKAIIEAINALQGVVAKLMDECDIQNSLAKTFDVLIKLNQYVTAMAPWVLIKGKNEGDKERHQTVLYVMVESMRIIALLLSPAMPIAGKKIVDAIGVPDDLRVGVDALTFGKLQPGTAFAEGEPPVLFQKKIKEKVVPVVKKKDADDVTAFDMRIGKVLKVDDHPNSDKMYVEMVDVGEEAPRQIVSGIRSHISKEDFEGSLVLIICNMAKATIQKVESAGMLLCATGDEKLLPVKIPEGTTVGEKVTFSGLEGVGYHAGQDINPKKVKKLMKDFKTDADGVVCWKEHKFTVPKGSLTSEFHNAVVK